MTATITTCRFCDDPISSSLGECVQCRRAAASKERLMSKPPSVEWTGSEPVSCDYCTRLIQNSFVDGKTKHGPWAVMCLGCHKTQGVGLGLGKGQKYVKSGASFVKTEG